MAPDSKQTDLVQGTLDMLILKTLALEPMHGFGIGNRIEQISKGVFLVNAGSLFPALRRLERDGPLLANLLDLQNLIDAGPQRFPSTATDFAEGQRRAKLATR